MSPFPPGSLLAACIRDSGHEDQELSALHQERSIREWCEKNGCLLTKVFIDSRSGKSAAKRDQFQAMMAYFRQPDVPEAGVVVWSYSRFARNALEAQFYRSELKQRGKTLYSLTEPVPTGPEAIIIEAAYDFAHQKYLDDLSDNTSTGLRDLVAIHGCIPGTPPRGFKRSAPIVTGRHRNGEPRTACRWVPDPELVPLIRQTYQMRLTGATLGRIHAATHLFSTINCYHGLFANKLYIGTLEYASLVIENYCDPIIDRPTWDAVQAIQSRFTSRHHVATGSIVHPRRLASAYLLSGIVFCLRCSAPLVGHTSTIKSGHTYTSYRCTNAKNRRDCTARLIPAAPLETEILRHLQDYVLRPEILTVMLEESLAAAQSRSLSLRPRQAGLRRKLSALDRQLGNLTRAIAASGHSAALLAELEQKETAKTAVLAELAAIEIETSTADQPAPTLDQISAACANLAEKLQQSDIQIRRRVLQSIINKIAVDRDEYGIHGILTLYSIALSPSPNLPITSAPGGSLDYSHNFTITVRTRSRSLSTG